MCSVGYKPMSTGELTALKGTPWGEQEEGVESFIRGLCGAAMVGSSLI